MVMKRITHVQCMVPFTELSILNQGNFWTCYPEWTKVGNVGILNDQNSLMDIWNGETMQYIRRAVLDNNLQKVCNFEYCPNAMRKEMLNLETMKREDSHLSQIIDQVRAGQTKMETAPYTLMVANSGKCNLQCIMCSSNDRYIKNDEQLDQKIYQKIIPEALTDISNLHLGANGEVFFNPYAVRFLQSLSFPSLKIGLTTNGTLFTPELWETISHNRYGFIGVSIDAATAETYERIRRNGKWDVLRRNLDFISELRRQYIFPYFRINFCVMKSNYHEMKQFAELGLLLGCDKVVFQKIHGRASITENINLTGNRKIFAEVGRILNDPIFNRPEIDTTQIDEYRKFAGKPVFPWDSGITKGKEWYYLRKKQSMEKQV